MKRRYLTVLALVAFALGIAVPAAYATNDTAYYKIAGGSSSCSYIRASNNPATAHIGGKTANFNNCDANDPNPTFVDMPAGRLKVWGYVVPASNTSVRCNYYHVKVTTVAASSIITTEYIEKKSEPACQTPNDFLSYAFGGRLTNDDGWAQQSCYTIPYYWSLTST